MKFLLPAQTEQARQEIARRLSEGQKVSVEVKEAKATRSLEQNSYLWGVVYPTVLEALGDSLEGWTADDLHEYFLGECFGWQKLSGFDRTRVKPLQRSSKLNKTEFVDYVMFIQRFMAEKGVYIPDPNEEVA